MIVACCCTYREGPSLVDTIDSALMGCDKVYVFEGPIGDAPESGKGSDFGSYISPVYGRWESDAHKRTAALEHVRHRHGGPVWVLWLDGDEVLLWPEYLRAWCDRVDAETGAGGFAIRIVEFDGSVAKSYSKIIRADRVARYLHSSYNIELVGSDVQLALPNVPICGAGGIPLLPAGVDMGHMSDEEQQRWLADCRPPLQGEPHLLHRSVLRDPSRGAQRQSEAEAEWYANEDRRLGI